MAKVEPVDDSPAGSDVVQVAATSAAGAAAASSMDGDSDTEQLSSDFQMDHSYTTSEQFQKALRSEAARKKSKDTTQTWKTVVIISGIGVALVGAIFAVSKKSKKVA